MNQEKSKSAVVADETISLTAEIVTAYVSNNPVPVGEVPAFLRAVHSTLVSLNNEQQEPPAPEPKPAVNPKKSIYPDYIICLEDGERFRSLKRHLMVKYGLTPDEYRAKWNLPADYPMVAPNYAAARSEMAKKMGLGRKAGAKPAPKARRKSA